jgi:UDP-N-acetylglucosamine--dolichyl-phosphate N-acetylglucosaminephosphotransferase
MLQQLVLVISLVASFLITYFSTNLFIRFLRNINVVGKDAHKKDYHVPEMGGPPVFIGLLTAMFLTISVYVFFLHINLSLLVSVFAGLFSITIVLLIGIFDDLTVLIKDRIKKFKRIGFKQWQRPLMILPAAIPLMAVSAGSTLVSVPFFGVVDFGILYPLLIVPLALVFVSESVNLLGGFNGLEGGMGLIASMSLGIFALIHSDFLVATLLLSFAASLFAYLAFNWYPSKIWPGDSLTHMIGVVLAVAAIIGNMEKATVIVLLPFIIEFFLKARSKFKAECFGKLRPDGKIGPPYGKNIYSWTHLLLNIKPMKEKNVTITMMMIQLAASSLMFVLILGNIL